MPIDSFATPINQTKKTPDQKQNEEDQKFYDVCLFQTSLMFDNNTSRFLVALLTPDERSAQDR